jgi:putative ABC transport system permease protein
MRYEAAMTFLRIIGKNLTRRPARTSMTIAGVGIAIAAVVALVGVARGIEQSFLDLYNERGADLVVQRAGGTLQLSSGIDERLGERIRHLPGVKQVIGGLMDLVAFEQYDLFAVIANGWDADCPVLDRVKMLQGRKLLPGDRREVMLGKVLAANLGKSVGDMIEVYAQKFKVVGVFESFSVYENGAVFLPLAEMQRLIDRPHRVTGYVVLATDTGNSAAINDLRRRIEALDPNVQATPTVEFVANISQIRVTRAGAWITSAIALFMGTIGILNTMITSVAERAKEIGVLRALGWRRLRIVRMVLCEASALSLGGAASGALFGVALLQLLRRLPQTAGIVAGSLPTIVIAQAAALAILVGLIGAAYPALWASKLRPADALRRQ